MKIHFEQAQLNQIDTIFNWLNQPHIQEFWDNTPNHKKDILNFVHGRVTPSAYADGKYVYWIASDHGCPFAMLMTIQETIEDPIDEIKLIHLSKTGHTYGIDYMIGDKNYLGKGYGVKVLVDFMDFFITHFDPLADTFLIDPASDNARAKHIYMQAGFEYIADFVMSGDVSAVGKTHHLLKRTVPNIRLLPET